MNYELQLQLRPIQEHFTYYHDKRLSDLGVQVHKIRIHSTRFKNLDGEKTPSRDITMPCFVCFRPRNKELKPSKRTPKSHDTNNTCTDSMVSALEGERQSLTSFVSFDVEGQEDRLANIEAQGRMSSRLFRSIVHDKAGFRSNGTLGSVSLWYSPKTVAGLPMISLGEIEVNGSVSLDSIINRIMNLERKGDWDPEFLMAKEISVHEIDEKCRVRTCWSACKSKPGIAGRDFVYHAFSSREDETWLVTSWSADIDEVHPDFAPKVQSAVHVRAKLILGGFFVRRSESGGPWLISYINQVELGLSSWLTEPVLKKNPQLLNNLKAVLEKECIV